MEPTYSTKTHSFDELYPLMLQINHQVRHSQISSTLFSGNFINEHMICGDYHFYTENDKIIGLAHIESVDMDDETDLEYLLNSALTHSSFEKQEIETVKEFFGNTLYKSRVGLLQGIRSFKPGFGKEMLESILPDCNYWFLVNTSGRDDFYEAFDFKRTGVLSHSGRPLLYKAPDWFDPRYV